MKYDVIVAGCGFSGATIAHLAAEKGMRVLMLEKRPHIAGNMYDERNEAGILVQRYGPHSFHTNRKEIYDFITSIGEWEPYILRARAMIDGVATPSPFNFTTIDQFYPAQEAEELKARLLAACDGREKAPILELLESKDPVVREYAEFLFEKDYRPYTAKQWGIAPEELDISVLARVPVRLSYVDRYFDDTYQLMPVGGFTAFFERLLDHPEIEIRLHTDILEHLSLEQESGRMLFDGEALTIPVVYTGPLDELFSLSEGRLPYRSLSFDFQTLPQKSYQETSGVAHPMAEGFTRITEFTKLPYQEVGEKTAIAVEYPERYGSERGREAYYPILTADSQRMYQTYREKAAAFPGLYLCGRLAEFQYYNMDDAIGRAIAVFDEI